MLIKVPEPSYFLYALLGFGGFNTLDWFLFKPLEPNGSCKDSCVIKQLI